MVGGGKGLSVGRCTALRSIRIDAEESFPVLTRVHIRAYCTWFAPDCSSPRYLPRLALSSEKSSSMFPRSCCGKACFVPRESVDKDGKRVFNHGCMQLSKEVTIRSVLERLDLRYHTALFRGSTRE